MADSNQTAESVEDTQGDALTGDESVTTESGAPGQTYEPSAVEATRGRQQGLGVGQKDIDYQRDPTASDSRKWLMTTATLRWSASTGRPAE